MRLEIASTDSQTSNADDRAGSPATTTSPPTDISPLRSSPDQAPAIKDEFLSPKPTFEQAGVFVADDEIIAVQVQDDTNPTGLRKTGFTHNLYDELPVKPLVDSRIPRSPAPLRRKSIDTTSNALTSGLPLTRKLPTYQSMRKPVVRNPITHTPKEPVVPKVAASKITNTWNGRAAPKKRPTVGADTFTAQKGSSTPEPTPSNFVRNSAVRASHSAVYDKNGRRVNKSTNSSPTKSPCPSPLAQQILEAAGNAKNDSQMLEKMKKLLSRYTDKKTSPVEPPAKDYEDDFTTAWVNSNGTLDRVTSAETPVVQTQSKRSSAASSIDSTLSREVSIMAARPNRGSSRIPAPVRQNTVLY